MVRALERTCIAFWIGIFLFLFLMVWGSEVWGFGVWGFGVLAFRVEIGVWGVSLGVWVGGKGLGPRVGMDGKGASANLRWRFGLGIWGCGV